MTTINGNAWEFQAVNIVFTKWRHEVTSLNHYDAIMQSMRLLPIHQTYRGAFFMMLLKTKHNQSLCVQLTITATQKTNRLQNVLYDLAIRSRRRTTCRRLSQVHSKSNDLWFVLSPLFHIVDECLILYHIPYLYLRILGDMLKTTDSPKTVLSWNTSISC